MKQRNNLTYFQFCQEVFGYDFFSSTGVQIYRWELFWSGVKHRDLMAGKTNFKLKIKMI